MDFAFVHGSLSLFRVSAPSEMALSTPLSALSPRIWAAIQGIQAEMGEGSDTDTESEGSSSECEVYSPCDAEGVDMEGVPRSYLFHVNHLEVHPSTPLAFLVSYANLGVVEVAVTSVEIGEKGEGEGQGTVDHQPMGTIHFPTPHPNTLVSLPFAFKLDPSAVIVSGNAVNALSRDRRAVLTVVGGEVVQSVMVKTAKVPKETHVVCTQGNEFRLFILSAWGVPTLLRIRPTLPVSWQPDGVTVTEEAASALTGAATTTIGPHSDGSVVVAVTRGRGTTHILRLDPVNASLALLCHLPSAVTHSVTRITCCDKTVLVSDSDGSCVTAVNTDTGSTRQCRVRGMCHSACPMGTVMKTQDSLNVAVREGTSLCVCPSAMDHCVRGHSLLWV
ncbi:hypothetical protein KIPB_007688, partial [Kipferlia bialata]|eukprot:g7688.t1